jgi:hypothetical protein
MEIHNTGSVNDVQNDTYSATRRVGVHIIGRSTGSGSEVLVSRHLVRRPLSRGIFRSRNLSPRHPWNVPNRWTEA